MPAAERTLTDFLQHSGEILPAVEQGDVLLRRRSGDDVVLVSRSHWQAVADSLRALAEEHQHDAPTGVRFSLPWLSLLPAEEQRACLDELRRTAVPALESGHLAALADVLTAWRATALATWDEHRSRERVGYATDESVPLPRP